MPIKCQWKEIIAVALLVAAMPISLFLIGRMQLIPTNTVVVSDDDGVRTVATLCWTRKECIENIASVCQEGFTIEHYFGNEMIGKCVR